MNTMGFVLDGLLVAVAVVGTVTDITRRKIYDWLTYPALVLGLVLQSIGFGWGGVFDPGLVSSVSGAGFCVVVFGAFWMWGKGFGAGDVKLMAALGAITGFVDALTLAMCAALVGALMALGRLFLTRSGLVRARSWFKRKKEDADQPESVTVPYGLAIGLGVVWSLLIKYKLVAGLIP
jgi:prepilin peptidase CpaA